jgi:hypothetical protein
MSDDELTQLRATIDQLQAQLAVAVEGLKGVKDRYIQALSENESATGALVVDLAAFAHNALKRIEGEKCER